ncbi:MAG: glycine cleavage system protein H [Actinobacteria bacterium]|uniref:Lipoyl-binding domain-containing protein n=1 Tax=marine metagenome TaxID=408172 RepID=A0A381PID7_9ZZZZ|nr:glycine cleavage system protein H [Actinomycetota bacterium]MEC8923208.1 glycine cleavage system protein GcvH [Actinomycetota bacterium]MEE3188083.1 glycine cleavage system protein GcvH [Actinomycetota bacterium]|tara:strand:- start:48 stop:440 length:393 start_codon:yes stop_codon:yes gene_type:complete
MNTPGELRYSTDHEWVRVEGDAVRVGISDFAQEALGDVVFVELPEVGLEVTVNVAFAEIESTKSVSDLFAPVSGEVLESNAALEDQPELVNEDPYGEGWICVLQPSDSSQLENLMDAEGYQSFVAEESSE